MYQQNFVQLNQPEQMQQNNEELLFSQFKKELQQITETKLEQINQIYKQNMQTYDQLGNQTQELIEQITQQISRKFEEFLDFLDQNLQQIAKDENFIQMVQEEILKFINDQNYYQQSIQETYQIRQNLEQCTTVIQQENNDKVNYKPQASFQSQPIYRQNEQSTAFQQIPSQISQQFVQQQGLNRPQSNVKGKIIFNTNIKNSANQAQDFMLQDLNSVKQEILAKKRDKKNKFKLSLPIKLETYKEFYLRSNKQQLSKTFK